MKTHLPDYKNNKPQAKQRGTIILISLVLLLIITLLGISAFELTEAEIKIVNNTKKYNLAFHAAETGLIKAVGIFEGVYDPTQINNKIDNFVSPILIQIISIDNDNNEITETIAHTFVSIIKIGDNPIQNSYLIIDSIGKSGDIGEENFAEAKLIQTMVIVPQVTNP